MESPKLKKRYRSFTASSYAFIVTSYLQQQQQQQWGKPATALSLTCFAGVLFDNDVLYGQLSKWHDSRRID
jgi:hypothetical protein